MSSNSSEKAEVALLAHSLTLSRQAALSGLRKLSSRYGKMVVDRAVALASSTSARLHVGQTTALLCHGCYCYLVVGCTAEVSIVDAEGDHRGEEEVTRYRCLACDSTQSV